ncbi:MAG: recombination-associated protein RdgC [Lentisphaeria bacterium]
MPFEQGNITFRICRLPEPLPPDCLERFAAQAALSLGQVLDEPVWGWVSGRHLLESRIDEETSKLGSYYHLCLRQAERKIPTSLLSAECRLIELTRMAETGNDRLNRKEKKSIKEEVKERLLPTMPPQISGTYIAIDPSEGMLYTSATSPRQMDLMLGYFNKAIGFEPIPLTPENIAADLLDIDPAGIPLCNLSPELSDAADSGTLGENFLTWLWFYQEKTQGVLPPSKLGEFSFLLDGPLVLVAEGGGALESNIRKGTPTVSAEAKAALLVGKKLRRAKLIFARNKGEEWSLTFDANDFIIKGLKLPDGEAMDRIGIFEERMTNLYIMQSVFFALFQRYLKELSDPQKATDYQTAAKKWIQEREGR